MSEVVSLGQRLTVTFLAFCSATGLLNVLGGVSRGTQSGLFLALAQGVFTLFTAAAAWNILQWRKIGWYLGFLVVLNWLSRLLNFRGTIGWFVLILSVPMAAMAIWLYLPAVRARFNVRGLAG
jgi:hypothetical protein